MGCKVANGTKCCFDCEITHCPYLCSGMGFNRMHKECDCYVEADYSCIQEEETKQ